jgi:hypothetical protein
VTFEGIIVRNGSCFDQLDLMNKFPTDGVLLDRLCLFSKIECDAMLVLFVSD